VPKNEFRRKLAIALFNIVFLITELDQARTLKDRIIVALKVSICLCSKNSCKKFKPTANWKTTVGEIDSVSK